MDRSHHVCEVTHAHVQDRSFSEHAVIELGLVSLGVIRCIANRLSILLLCVASPHTVNGYLACKEVVRALFKHFCMTQLHTNLIILAILVSVSEKTNLVRVWCDLFHLKS